MNSDYLKIAILLAYKAGKIIIKNFRSDIEVSWKKDTSPVTKADLEINKLVIREINKNYPTHSILAEEESDLHENSEFLWVCDPIDGTYPFSYGVPTCVFSLALVKEGEPILGVIFDPFLNRLYTAEKDKGAYLNNKRIKVSSTKDLEKSLIGICHWKGSGFNILKFVDNFRSTINVQSTIYMGSLVAAGSLDANIFPGKNAHDTATQKIIIEEAGGKVTDILGKPQKYDKEVNGILATNSHLHADILEIIATSNNISLD
ncbi:hypothetical protein GF362_03555 [Candidatus Dojkabacteria bacterium]|nr:hypothetical protein [Candidatus Dojkabacteria bacterium]